MTPERLEEIEKRAQAATPGPWWQAPYYESDVLSEKGEVGRGSPWDTQRGRWNAEFIANARQDVPDLLEEVRRLKGIIAADDERLREAGQRVDIDMGCDTAHWMANAIEGLRESIEATRNEVASVLLLMDGLAEVWGDEGVFRTCRDRLRKLIPPDSQGEE